LIWRGDKPTTSPEVVAAGTQPAPRFPTFWRYVAPKRPPDQNPSKGEDFSFAQSSSAEILMIVRIWRSG
jgi:hypothetical protein